MKVYLLTQDQNQGWDLRYYGGLPQRLVESLAAPIP